MEMSRELRQKEDSVEKVGGREKRKGTEPSADTRLLRSGLSFTCPQLPGVQCEKHTRQEYVSRQDALEGLTGGRLKLCQQEARDFWVQTWHQFGIENKPLEIATATSISLFFWFLEVERVSWH